MHDQTFINRIASSTRMPSYQTVKGTNDFSPEQFSIREQIFARLRETAKCYGFNEVDTPAIETVSLLTAKSGEELTKQLFTIEKKSDEKLALRFDLTVPFTRLFVEKQKTMQKPVKWFGINKMWRYESPQKGREREFFQLSAELFGSARKEADAELLNLFISCYESVGLTANEIFVRLNNRKLLEGLLEGMLFLNNNTTNNNNADNNIDTNINTNINMNITTNINTVASTNSIANIAKLMQLVDKSGKITAEEFTKELTALKIDKKTQEKIKMLIGIKGTVKEVEQKLKIFALNNKAKDGLQEIKNIVALVSKAEQFIVVDLSIARGIEYYTGIVFECFDREGKYRALGGGGRYDNLVELFGGDKTPATGFGIGYSTLSLLLLEKKKLPYAQLTVDYFIAPINEQMILPAIKIASALRKKFNSSVDIDLMGRKLPKQIDYANSIVAKELIVIGEKEVVSNTAKARNLKTGKERKIDLKEFLK